MDEFIYIQMISIFNKKKNNTQKSPKYTQTTIHLGCIMIFLPSSIKIKTNFFDDISTESSGKPMNF